MGVNRRKTINYSVKRNMQIRLFLKVFSISLIGIALMAVIFYLYSNREINENYRQFHIHAQNFLDYLLPTVALSALAAVFSAAAITIFSVYAAILANSFPLMYTITELAK